MCNASVRIDGVVVVHTGQTIEREGVGVGGRCVVCVGWGWWRRWGWGRGGGGGGWGVALHVDRFTVDIC